MPDAPYGTVVDALEEAHHVADPDCSGRVPRDAQALYPVRLQ